MLLNDVLKNIRKRNDVKTRKANKSGSANKYQFLNNNRIEMLKIL